MRARIFITLLAPLLGLPDLASGQEPSFYEPMVGNGQQQLVKLAKEQEELFVRRGVRFNDPELLDIVNRVGETIFPVVLDEYINFRVYLIRDPSPIAFSLADGQIYIHTGLLARLGDEAQLAAVLAHEAHHVAAHHHILANSARRKKANIAGGIAVALNRGESGQSFPSEFGDQYSTTSYASLIGGNPQSVFSSNQEIEADAASIGLIGRAGHPPAASLQAIASIRQDPELSTPSPLASFTSYDSLTERQGLLQELVDGLPVQSANATITYDLAALVLRRVIEMTIDDYIRLDRPGTAVALIDAMIKNRPDAFLEPEAFLYAAKGDSHLEMGPAPTFDEQLTTMDSKKWGILANLTRAEADAYYLETEQGRARLAKNLESAAIAYNAAIELDTNNARAYRGLGDLHFAKEEFRQSGRNYIKYLKLSPNALDRPIVLQKLQHIKAELSKQKETEK